MLKILCFGDSITLGEKDIEQGGWADRLKKYYFKQSAESQTQKVTLYNLGVASETTDGLVKRFELELKARSIKGQKLIILFAYGANDIVIHKNKNIVPDSYYIRNLKLCIESAKKSNADILLLSLLPIGQAIEGVINQHGKLRFDHDIQKYNLAVKNLAYEVNCEYLNLYKIFTDDNKEQYLSNDGVHPNSKGHELLYNTIKEKLFSLSS
ncbi:MAG: GDSL-type esterase/lipase family protein [Gammaproteobacteria bacterium]|nr:GDSL-type esterase/lipase family protein [Gammaproteobacteria bacterium]